eukprot:2691206-Pyramimonas_sp.AAC.1
MADLQVVHDSSGAGCFALICKQLQSLGMPLWSGHAPTPGRPRCIIYCSCTDAGGDVSKARRVIASQVQHVPELVWLDCDCMHHQSHLIEGGAG